ncbi:expressed unknown protein [Seminavis robusta]|uniref:Uncharacterized protein n=1 Tax=Seminavis robusta TaxID=568900 RepID=A0A9N8E950_9STRA|nr:expressed unknown protein [Seminavis robusta]|eukprot:Sro821_g207450.1 n/a (431) ;mRNA; r:44478-45954
MLFSKPTTESTRHYYSKDKLFEKSLDIYKPIDNDNNKGAKDDASKEEDLPIVILVVGSGWVGHRAFVYAGTSWWNSSGPKTIASLGTTCVCIRHRGAFCVLPQREVVVQYLTLLFATVGAITGGHWDVALAVTVPLAVLLILLALGGRGSATLDDMLEDVVEAIQWIDSHRDLLELHSSSSVPTTTSTSVVGKKDSMDSTQSQTTIPSETSTTLSASTGSSDLSCSDNGNTKEQPMEPATDASRNPRAATPMVFGGYSSGGHVATTLLHQPKRFQKHGLSPPEELFQGILVISGMMAVRPERITVQDCKTQQPITIATPSGLPTFLTNLVLQTVWGAETAKHIPSPLTQARPPPALPHLLVGCRNEMFGLNWLDVYFCSAEYRDKVQALTGQVAKYVQVESDHWNVLSSTALRNALQEELPQLVGAKNPD